MKLSVVGGKRLKGRVRISGAKNSVLKLMAAALLSDGGCIIANVPRITDVFTMIDVIRALGVEARFGTGDVVYINPSNLRNYETPKEPGRLMRASIQVMGPLLVRLGKARVPKPGGCNIGDRPIDLHLKGFAAMGAKVKEEHGFVEVQADRLKGAEIHLDFPSVGATENIMTAACLAEGTTVIKNAAREPEIVDQQNFLNRMGGRISGAGTDTIRVRGVSRLGPTEYAVIPDRIEAATYMEAFAVTGGEGWVDNVIAEHLQPVIAKLVESGAKIHEENSSIMVAAEEPLKALIIRAFPYPGFPTDLQPQTVALLSVSKGTSIISDHVFPSRFGYINQLRKMGARIRLEGRVAIIEGVKELSGASVGAPDLRGGAALVIAGLAARGVTEIEGIERIDRGYEDLDGKLTMLGAKVTRVC